MTPEERVDAIQENVDKISKIIDAVVTSDRKDAIVKMLEDDTFGQLYFTAPASSREEYHYCWPGGLAAHSLNVFKNLRDLNKTFNLKFDAESMCIVTLFHDIGKAAASDLESPHYTANTDDWKLKKGWIYDYSQVKPFMTNHLRSIFILQSFEIKLSAEEFTAIYLNDGQYLNENRPYSLKECPLALYTHLADRIALEMERTD